MSDSLDLKTTGIISVVVAAVIGGLKYFARWQTPEDVAFSRQVRDELRKEIERAQERYDELLRKHDELFERFEKLHRELLDEKARCADRLTEMEEKMQAFIDARGVCDRSECPSRLDINDSGAWRRVIREPHE